MLRLRADQLEALDALLATRRAGAVQAALERAWPAVAAQLGERWPAFVSAALAHGRSLGWQAAPELGVYAGLCCLWGAGFIWRPGFEGAAAIVADARRSPALRLHQLVQWSRQGLQQRPGPVTAEAFDAACAQVAATLAQGAHEFFTDPPPPAPREACDLEELAFELVQPQPAFEYRLGADGWAHVAAAPLGRAPQVWREAPADAALLALTSPEPGTGQPAQLRLALNAPSRCAEHPLVTHRSAAGRQAWRGAAAVRLAVPLPAAAQEAGAGIAAPGTVDLQSLAVQTCGVRDAGAPFGAPSLALQVHPATQWLVQVQHDPVRAECLLEADGAPRDAAAWAAAWRELQPRCRAGLEKLLNAWAREASPGSERLLGRCDALAGRAGVTWGWRASAPGAVALHVEGRADFCAVDLDLTLEGDIAFAGAAARITLRMQGREEWREVLGAGRPLADAKRAWRHPVQVTLAPQVADGPVLALLAAEPTLAGAVTGRCGLRPRPDGRGWQWHFGLETEPVVVMLSATDPLLGEQRTRRELLPAMTLVEWSAG